MMRKRMSIAGAILLSCIIFSGCAVRGTEQENKAANESSVTEDVVSTEENSTESDNEGSADNVEKVAELPDGIYLAEFDTDSSMFHVNETCDGKGTLTVENGKMTIHISLSSKNIVNLYAGLAEDAAKEGAELLMPAEDVVTYPDGLTEEVYGFDVPVPSLDEEFDLALIGTKGIWYDHKVKVSNPKPVSDE